MFFFVLLAVAFAEDYVCENKKKFTINANGVINKDSIKWGQCSESSVVELVIGNGVTELSDDLFKGASSLEKITFGTGLKKIGNKCFETISSSAANKDSKDLTFEVVIPGNVESIGNDVFKNPKTITHLKIKGNDNLVIGSGFFANAPALKEVKIEGNVKSFGDDAFKECPNLKTFVYEGKKSPECKEPKHFMEKSNLTTIKTGAPVCGKSGVVRTMILMFSVLVFFFF